MHQVTAFADLSREGKLTKIRQHLATPHPVPGSWVEWLLGEIDTTPQCEEGDHPAGSNGDKCFACFVHNNGE